MDTAELFVLLSRFRTMVSEAQQIIDSCIAELQFTTSRSGGPGGQHVNKVETKVTLRWPVDDSPGLTPEQRAIIIQKLGTHINQEGTLVLQAGRERSQLRNKHRVIAKWKQLVHQAMHIPKKRRATRPSQSALRLRKKGKQRRSDTKALRKKPEW